MLALINNAKITLPQNSFDPIVFLEVGEDAKRRDLRVEVDEQLLVGSIELSEPATIAQSQREHL